MFPFLNIRDALEKTGIHCYVEIVISFSSSREGSKEDNLLN